MNSSMKQPPPVSKSLNDLLMKGPPALADLFSVTIGMRESKYALAKDISKFYNSVDADPWLSTLVESCGASGTKMPVPKFTVQQR